MIIELNMADEVPIYIQLRNAIIVGIGRGELRPGERLPTVRQMAEDIGVNAMTVNKTYALLKSEGYIEIDRRKGACVSRKQERTVPFQKKAKEELMLLISEASFHQISKEEFLSLCEQVYQNLENGKENE